MANTYLYRQCDATASSGYSSTWTWSGWVKRSKIGEEQGIFQNKKDASVSASRFRMGFKSSDRLGWECKDSTSNDDNSFETNMLFRDTNAWYHIVFSYDSTQGTEANRLKLWVNGVDIRNDGGGFSSINEASNGFGTLWSSASKHFIGYTSNNSGTAFKMDGCMSHLHLTYGTTYTASTFGSTDSTTGEWKINTNPNVTYGSQGYFMLKNDNSVTDQSGNSNNFTVGGGIFTKTEDCPSNVFATWNPLSPNDSITYSYGNGVVTGSNATNYSMSCSTTLGASSGKYYWEMKYSTAGNGNECIGVANFDNYEYNQNMTTGTTGYVSLRWDGERQINGALTSNYFTPPSTGAVLMCAMDMDNGKVFFGSNGTWFGSGNPVTGANPTADILTSGTWGGILRYLSSKWECNFGNGYFADNTVSSAGTNASGNGIFEYDVPTGFTALSTKGLNL